MTDRSVASPPLQNLHINFDDDDVRAVAAAFDGPGFSGKAPIVARYEAAIAAYFGSPYALACSNGTVAIELALRGLRLEDGARVALPPTAPIMTVLPILVLGGEPVFYDVCEGGFAPDVDDLARLAERRLDAVITVPMWGYPWDMTPVTDFCRERGIALIEDCAHAFGTTMGGRPFGTFGDVAAFSTHERKLVSTGEGGFCLTADRGIRDRMRSFQHHGLNTDDPDNYRLGERIGSNYKIAPLCAALGISQFEKLDAKIAKRREIATKLRARLRDQDAIREIDRYPGAEVNGYALVFHCRDEDRAQERAAVLAARGIQSDTVRYQYKPLYREPAFQAFARPCPNAERLIRSIITLPCHEGLTDADLDRIATTVATVYPASSAVAEAS